MRRTSPSAENWGVAGPRTGDTYPKVQHADNTTSGNVGELQTGGEIEVYV